MLQGRSKPAAIVVLRNPGAGFADAVRAGVSVLELLVGVGIAVFPGTNAQAAIAIPAPALPIQAVDRLTQIAMMIFLNYQR
jgi:hypothetical protein